MNKSLKKVISRINATYGRWRRDTPIETMRDDWDQLFASKRGDVVVEDLQIDGLACRWVKAPTLANDAVVLFVHGGGFRLGSIDSHLKLMSDIACEARCQVLGFNYTLMPEAAFPTQLDEALGVYRWLLEQGHHENNILVAGDSAGGGIAAALLQRIKLEDTSELPQPAGVILLSAWLDMTLSGESYQTRQEQDPVHQTKMLATLAKLYAGKTTDLKDPLLSPMFGDLSELPPTLLQVGDHEIGLSDSTAYADKMRSAGGSVEISVWSEMIHVFQMYSNDLPKAREAIKEIGVFVRKVAANTTAKPMPYMSKSKVTPPSLPNEEIKRSKLIDELGDHSATRKLTVLQAPAGYGKSTTMRQILELYKTQGVVTIWLNFDDADNDVSRFLASFYTAVAPHCEELNYEGWQTLRDQELMDVTAEYLNTMVGPTALFFDNVEKIKNPAVLGLIARGIEDLPEGWRVFLGSRTTPAVGLAKISTIDQLNNIQADVLRFSEEEARKILTQKTQVPLPLEQTRQLHQRTDGWPVALKLASLALHGKDNADHFIENFSGTNAAVAAYLAEEVLTSLPDSMQDFLLHSSIFHEMHVDICDRVLERNDSLQVLIELQERNLFVSRSDNQPTLFHYHNLFRDFLQIQLQRRHPEIVSGLHETASQVYLNRGRPIPAIRHALKSGDTELALQLLKEHGDALLAQGRIGLLARLLEQLPIRVIDQHPHLKLLHALCVTYTRGPRPGYELVAHMDESTLPAESAAHLMALRPIQLGMMDRIDEAHTQGLAAWKKNVDAVPNARKNLSQALTQTSIILGNHEQAREFCDQARYSPGTNVDVFNLVLAESAESGMELMEGRLKQASHRMKLALDRQKNDAHRRARGVSMASIQLAEILYEQGDTPSARRLLATHSALVQDMGPPDSLITANVILSRILYGAGELEQASQVLIELESSGHRLQLPRVVGSARLERSRLWLAQGDIDGAREQLDLAARTYDWNAAKDLWFSANDTLVPEIIELRLLLRTGNSNKALPVARRLLKTAEHARRYRRALKLRILLAETLYSHGDVNSALRTMTEAMEFADREGFVETFQEEGPTLRPIFEEMGISAPKQPYSSDTLSPTTNANSPTAPAQQANAELPNEVRLTKKEMDVLTVLAMGLSNVAMAEKLFVSESTVRTHLRNINSKLNAKNRTEAVSIARQIGLIS